MANTLTTATQPIRRSLLALVGLLCISASLPVGAADRSWRVFLYGGDGLAVVGHKDDAWVGTGAGIRVYTPQDDGIKVVDGPNGEDLPGSTITALTFADNHLWAAAAGGTVGCFDQDANKWAYYGAAEHYPAADTSRLLYDGTDLWAATVGGGVARFSQMRKDWHGWDEADGLPSNQVLSLAANPTAVWAATAKAALKPTRKTTTAAISSPNTISRLHPNTA